MTKEEIEDIIENLFIKHSYEDGFGYDVMSLPNFKQAFLEGIAEIQKLQEPVAWVYPARYGSAVGFVKPTEPNGPKEWNDDTGEWYCYPLFTFPPAQKPQQSALVPKMARCSDCGQRLPDTKDEPGVKYYCGPCGQMHGM